MKIITEAPTETEVAEVIDFLVKIGVFPPFINVIRRLVFERDKLRMGISKDEL